MEVRALLSDYAEAINGKLYVHGGGWNMLVASQAANVAVAMLVIVPWDRGDARHRVDVRLLDHDGGAVRMEDREVAMSTDFELGRPAGVKPGTPLNAPFAYRFQGMRLDPGGYVFRISLNDDEAVPTLPFPVPLPREAA